MIMMMMIVNDSWVIHTYLRRKTGGQRTVLPIVKVWRHYDKNRKYSSGRSGSGTEYNLLSEKTSDRRSWK